MFFNKKKKPLESVDQDVAAQNIADWIINIQVRIATVLNAKTAHYTKSQKQVLLLVISILFSALSLYLIFKSLF